MSKHTPGPWKWGQESIDPEWAVVTSQGGCIIANVNSETGPDIPPLVSTKMPQHANAAIIAAAPDMYVELMKQRDWLLHIKGQIQAPNSILLGFDQSIKYINRVLAQAEGR